MTTVLLALAGGLGAGTRYSLDAWIRPRVRGDVPWSTALINVTGSFLLGLIVGLSPDGTWHAVVGTGFCGGYTTFSTASVETLTLVSEHKYAAAAITSIGMLVMGVAAASLGYVVGR